MRILICCLLLLLLPGFAPRASAKCKIAPKEARLRNALTDLLLTRSAAAEVTPPAVRISLLEDHDMSHKARQSPATSPKAKFIGGIVAMSFAVLFFAAAAAFYIAASNTSSDGRQFDLGFGSFFLLVGLGMGIPGFYLADKYSGFNNGKIK